MRARAVWFVAGSAAGVYASAKARKAAYRLSMPGLIDQAAALGLGWRAFADEVRDGMAGAEDRLSAQISPPPGPEATRASIEAAPADSPELTDERDHP